MRSRNWFAVGLAVLLVIPATTTAFAATSAEQVIELEVLEPGMLAINVAEGFGLGSVVPGTTAGPFGFWMEILNTTTEDWTVSVTGTDLQSFDYECDDWGCWQVIDPLGPTIDASNIHVRGGTWAWDDPYNVNPITFDEGTLGETPLTIVWGRADVFGRHSLGSPSPEVWVEVPVDAVYDMYRATLTYTIQSVTP